MEICRRSGRLCVEGNRLWYDFAKKYRLPCKQVGKLLVARDAAESRRLDQYLQLAKTNRVPDVHKIGSDEVKRLEPNVRAHSALRVPTSGIIDPTALLHQVYASASNRGVNFMSGTQVVDLELSKGQIMVSIRYRDGNEDRVAADHPQIGRRTNRWDFRPGSAIPRTRSRRCSPLVSGKALPASVRLD